MSENIHVPEGTPPTHMQSVYVELTDGTSGIFTGPAIVKPGDKVSVKSVAFGVPEPLPPGYMFAVKE